MLQCFLTIAADSAVLAFSAADLVVLIPCFSRKRSVTLLLLDFIWILPLQSAEVKQIHFLIVLLDSFSTTLTPYS